MVGWLLFLMPIVMSAEGNFNDEELPIWLCAGLRSREVFIGFECLGGGRRRIARSTFGFIVANLASLIRADGDGFAAVTPGLESVLLVNVTDDPKSLEIDAWGDFVHESPKS